MRGPGLLVAVWLVASLLPLVLSEICRHPSHWTVDGQDPMTSARGKVTVVALLLATWNISRRQAIGLEALHSLLRREGYTDLQFMIVNNKANYSINEIGELQSLVSFPVHQDTNEHLIWRKLNGHKEDILIYDRCGRLTFRLPYPDSLLRYQYIRIFTILTYNRNLCNCRRHNTETPVNRRPRRHLHHNQHHGDQNAIMNIHTDSDRDRNRTPKCLRNRPCRRRLQHRHRLLRTLWDYFNNVHSVTINRSPCICLNLINMSTRRWRCRQAYLPESLNYCSWPNPARVVGQCVCYDCNLIRQRRPNTIEVIRPLWQMLTSWRCSYTDLSNTASWQWPTQETHNNDITCRWQDTGNGSHSWQWQGSSGACLWLRRGHAVHWQWPTENTVWSWHDQIHGDDTWHWHRTNISASSWQCEQGPNESSKTWQWQQNNSSCLWQWRLSQSGELHCQWPIGETPTAVLRWRTGRDRLTGRCHWPTVEQDTDSWQWHEANDQVSWSWQGLVTGSCQWHSSNTGSGVNWQCPREQSTTRVWSWLGQNGRPVGQCSWHTVSNTWGCQTSSGSGLDWQDPNSVWSWQARWQWQVNTWHWQRNSAIQGQRSLWLWRETRHSWNCPELNN